MHRKILLALISIVVLLLAAHDADHAIRGDFGDLGRLARASAILLAAVGAGVLTFWGRLGFRFWAIAGAGGAAFLWFGHFSPFSKQRTGDIFAAYDTAAAGAAAVGLTYALMLALLSVAALGAFLWVNAARDGRAPGIARSR